MWIVWYRTKEVLFEHFAGQFFDQATAVAVMTHLIDQGYIARVVHF
jgi:hypothetical protein